MSSLVSSFQLSRLPLVKGWIPDTSRAPPASHDAHPIPDAYVPGGRKGGRSRLGSQGGDGWRPRQEERRPQLVCVSDRTGLEGQLGNVGSCLYLPLETDSALWKMLGQGKSTEDSGIPFSFVATISTNHSAQDLLQLGKLRPIERK